MSLIRGDNAWVGAGAAPNLFQLRSELLASQNSEHGYPRWFRVVPPHTLTWLKSPKCLARVAHTVDHHGFTR